MIAPTPESPVSDAHAVRIAKRLAHHATRTGRRLPSGMLRRLWALLDAHPVAREVYGRPVDKLLHEHARGLTPDELEDAASRLAETLFPGGEGGTP
mgnify:CR=1 FL=1